MSDCDFCKYLADLEQVGVLREENAPWMNHDFHVLILERNWNDYTGTHHAGEMTHRPKAVGFDINFCPECGKQLVVK